MVVQNTSSWAKIVTPVVLTAMSVGLIAAWTRVAETRDQVIINTQRLTAEERATAEFAKRIEALSDQMRMLAKDNSTAHGEIQKQLGEAVGLLRGHVDATDNKGGRGLADKGVLGPKSP